MATIVNRSTSTYRRGYQSMRFNKIQSKLVVQNGRRINCHYSNTSISTLHRRFQPIVINPLVGTNQGKDQRWMASNLSYSTPIDQHLRQLKSDTRSRTISSMTEVLPEFISQYSIWGTSSIILKTFHGQGVPYWGCMSLTNVLVRTSLFPLVLKGAKTSAKFANVAPEVQFLVSSFQNDSKKLREANARPSQKLELLIATWQSLRGIYKLHGVNPLDVLKVCYLSTPSMNE